MNMQGFVLYCCADLVYHASHGYFTSSTTSCIDTSSRHMYRRKLVDGPPTSDSQ